MTPEDIYKAKQARRAAPATLSLDEKIALIEKLRDTARSLIAARQSLDKEPHPTRS